jgi:ABC-type transport system involved in multi-copper enzyme maturation permease subunit
MAAGVAVWATMLVAGLLGAMWSLNLTIVPGKSPPAADAEGEVTDASTPATGAAAPLNEPSTPPPPRLTSRMLAAPLFDPLARGLDFLLGPEWYEGALYHWLLVLVSLVGTVFAIGWLVAAVRTGPVAATARSGRILLEAVLDLARTSPRRVWALAWLAFRDSLRRKALVVFAVFLVLMAFAGWFLSPESDHPARLYLQFVLIATGYLMLLMALFLSALSLPGDIKDRTITTIVTKPVRATEIVLGRVLGFTAIGTLLLGGMAAVSYVFTVRGLAHTHQLTAAMLHDEVVPGRPGTWQKGATSFVHGHKHDVSIPPSGDLKDVKVEVQQDHWHAVVSVEGSGKSAVYRLGPPQGMLVARVPIYGKLRFLDDQGRAVERGINVGDEWTYRSFLAGGGRATAIWTFTGISRETFPESMFPEAIPIEMTIEVYRSHKGDLSKPILGRLWVRNPKTQRQVDVRNFGARKFATDVQWIPRTLVDRKSDGRTERVDLLDELVSDDGQLEIGLQCLEPGQYFGVAQPDLYFRARDASFAVNFLKGFAGLWMQMVLVLAMGVMLSTFLSAPVAILATAAAVLGGLCSGYIAQLAAGKMLGGGPFESFIRILTQQNMIMDLDQGLQTNVALMSDKVMQGVLWIVSAVLPAFEQFDLADRVAYGFDISGLIFWKCLLRAAAFLLPAMVAGYFFLKTREVAK